MKVPNSISQKLCITPNEYQEFFKQWAPLTITLKDSQMNRSQRRKLKIPKK